MFSVLDYASYQLHLLIFPHDWYRVVKYVYNTTNTPLQYWRGNFKKLYHSDEFHKQMWVERYLHYKLVRWIHQSHIVVAFYQLRVHKQKHMKIRLFVWWRREYHIYSSLSLTSLICLTVKSCKLRCKHCWTSRIQNGPYMMSWRIENSRWRLTNIISSACKTKSLTRRQDQRTRRHSQNCGDASFFVCFARSLVTAVFLCFWGEV